MQWNMTGITVAGTGTAGSALNQLSSPKNIFLDSIGNLYISDSANHRIVRYAPGASSGTVVAGVTGINGSLPTLLNSPSDVFVDVSGNIYVADRYNRRIQFFSNGSLTGVTLTTNWNVGHIWGVHVLSSGFIYGCDLSNNTIWRNGTAFAGNQGAGSGANQLNQPQGFAVDSSLNVGTAYIANSVQHTIVQWLPGASTGTIVAGTNGVSGNDSVSMKFPVAVKLDLYNNIYVADNNNNRIQLYCRYPTVSSSARTIAGTGLAGSLPSTLRYPTGLTLDAQLNLYVSDTSNHRIQLFRRLI